jgi:hypothetical protein
MRVDRYGEITLLASICEVVRRYPFGGSLKAHPVAVLVVMGRRVLIALRLECPLSAQLCRPARPG